MSTHNARELAAKVSDLRTQLESAEKELVTAVSTRQNDPVDYIGKLIYANKTASGTYGYEYGNYGDTERARAQKVIDAAGGDLDIAERFVTEFHIR